MATEEVINRRIAESRRLIEVISGEGVEIAPPITRAGEGVTATVGVAVALSSRSSDDDETTRRWTDASGKELGAKNTLSFTPLTAGEHIITLTVTDSEGESSSTSARVLVDIPGAAPDDLPVIPPTAPDSLAELESPIITSGTIESATEITVEYETVEGATDYIIEMSEEGGAYQSVGVSTTPQLLVSGLTAGLVYRFRVRARDVATDRISALSEVRSVKIPIAAAPGPSVAGTPSVLLTSDGEERVRVEFNEATTLITEYGPTSALGSQTSGSSQLRTLHVQTMPDANFSPIFMRFVGTTEDGRAIDSTIFEVNNPHATGAPPAQSSGTTVTIGLVKPDNSPVAKRPIVDGRFSTPYIAHGEDYLGDAWIKICEPEDFVAECRRLYPGSRSAAWSASNYSVTMEMKSTTTVIDYQVKA